MTTLKIALVQCTAGLDPAANASALVAALETAAQGGAQLVFTPEMSNVIDKSRDRLLPKLKPEAEDATLPALQTAAKRLSVWLAIGSLAVLRPDGKVANRSLLIDDSGQIRARYDKIHLFDVALASGETYRESATYAPGAQAVVAQTPWGKLGLSICYDVRFGHLHRTLAKAGADILAVPAAFTKPTGEAHWHALMRARAIETGAYVVAAAQTGRHEDGRDTFGHSLVVSPWGEVLADGGTAPGLVWADLDLAAVAKARAQIPALQHDRPFELVEA
jgi:deaminated glutathione amidase